jgi:S-(hydroxymethyl)glutathione dehydrogenase / alcohol dehydrogenase
MKMKAAVLRENNQPLSVEEVELLPPKEKEVLVKTAYTGFCHTDLSMIRGVFNMPLPMVLGHEAAGVVEKVGPGVTTQKEGDHVVTTWMVACGHCPECRKGLGHMCRTSFTPHGVGGLLDMTSRLVDSKGARLNHQQFISGFAEYMVVPEPAAIKINKDVSLDQACFLGCALPTGFGAVYNAAGVKPGDSVAIWGMGGVGLNVVRGAKLRGANPVIGVDIEGSKEAIAREFGVSHFINSSKEDPVPIIKELTDGGANFCFEAIGDTGAITQAYWALGMAGKLIQIGITDEPEMTKLPLFYNPLHCKSIIGTLYGNIDTDREIPALADLAASGELKLDKLISRRFRIGEINEAVDAMSKRKIVGRWVCVWE